MYSVESIKPTHDNRTPLANKCYEFVGTVPEKPGLIDRAIAWVLRKRYGTDLLEARQLVADTYDFAFSPGGWDAKLLAENLGDYINNMSHGGWKQSVEVGRLLQRQHRTLQRQLVELCFGILKGLGEQEYTDDRNKHAIPAARKVGEMYESGEIKIGAYI